MAISGFHRVCCCAKCCQCGVLTELETPCDRTAAICCYSKDDILCLTVEKNNPDRICSFACGSDQDLGCEVCVDFSDTARYIPFFCGTMPDHCVACNNQVVSFVMHPDDIDGGKLDCFPLEIQRCCCENEWIFFDRNGFMVSSLSLPLCSLCTNVCTGNQLCNNQLLCESYLPQPLFCDCIECNTSNPPCPYVTCTHNDNQEFGGTTACFCSGAGCYDFRLVAYFSICHFEETLGACLGDNNNPSSVQRIARLEVEFDIEHHCGMNNSQTGCRNLDAGEIADVC